MAYFNDANNTSSYSTPSASGEFYSYPLPSRTFATDTEGTNSQVYAEPTDEWSMVRRSGPMVEPPTSLWATGTYESVAPTTPHTRRTDDYSWLSYGRSRDHQDAQSHPSGFLSRHGSFASTAASEASAAVHTPRSGEYSLEELGAHRSQTIPLNYRETNQSGASTSALYMENVNTSHWPMTGPTMAEMEPTGRYHPYEVPRTCPTCHRDAEAGPSTPATPLIPYINPPKARPSGRISETTADAETTSTVTEEDRAPKPKRAMLPRGQGKPRPTRVHSEGVGQRLCELVYRKNKLPIPPTVNQALDAALKIIGKRPPFYSEPRLQSGHGERTVKGSKNADSEFRRRKRERGLYEELSRFYLLPETRATWTRPQLLAKVLRELGGFDKPPS